MHMDYKNDLFRSLNTIGYIFNQYNYDSNDMHRTLHTRMNTHGSIKAPA